MAVRAGGREDVPPLERLQRSRSEDRGRNCHRVDSEEDYERDRKLRTGHGAGGGGAKLLIDLRRFGENDFERALRKRCGQIVRAGKQLHQLPPAHGAIVRVGSRLGQHRLQTIIKPHATFASFKTGRLHRSSAKRS